MIIRAYKYRLNPNKEQVKQLENVLWQSRDLYNFALEQRKTHYEETNKNLSFYDQSKWYRKVRDTENRWEQLNSHTCLRTLMRLDRSYKSFFRRVKGGETPGFPRFKGKDHWKSVEFTYNSGCRLQAKENGKKLFYIQHVGQIPVIYHRVLPENAVIKCAIVKKTASDKWFVSLSMELSNKTILHQKANITSVGIDMGLKYLLAMSDGKTIDNPRWFRESAVKLRVAQRKFERKEIGSNHRTVAKNQVALVYEKVSNQRRDFWHKITRQLVTNHSHIAIEDLDLKFMLEDKHLALSANDASLGIFTKLLDYKAEEAGCQVIKVNPAYTSQTCSQCGVIVKKKLSERTHECPDCGLVMDRDLNAAKNILIKSGFGQSLQTLT